MQRSSIMSLCLLLCLASSPACASSISWRALTPEQREALAPLVQQWDTLPELHRNRLIITAKGYQSLTPEKKRRYHERLAKWSKLTPEQREAARKKYRALSKAPPAQREKIKQKYKEDQAHTVSKSVSKSTVVPVAPPQ